MPKPWEVTREEAKAHAEQTRKRFEEADLIAMPLLLRKLREPWEVSPEEAKHFGERMRTRREAADRIAVPLAPWNVKDRPIEKAIERNKRKVARRRSK